MKLLAENIKKHGITNVFGIIGGGQSLSLVDELLKQNIFFHTTYFEASAAIMAGTMGHLTGKAGVALSIKGPGLANMVPGLAVCSFENYPLVAMCEAYPKDALISKAHKRMNHEILTKEVTKSNHYFTDNAESYNSVARYAESEIPGPVILNLAEGPDENKNKKKEQEIEANNLIYKYLDTCQNPIIIAGALAVRQGWSDRLSKLNIPVFTTASAKGLIDETLTHAAGVYTGAGLDRVPENSLIYEADLVIGLGLRNTEVLVAKPFPCPAVNIDSIKGTLGTGFEFSAMAPLNKTAEVFNRLGSVSWGIDQTASIKKDLTNYLLNQDFLPATVLNIVSNYFNRKVRLVVDTGYFCTIAEHVWAASKSDLFLCAGNSRYMGTAIPMAIGATFYDDSVPTVAVLGDGGIGMYIAELKLAVQNKLPLLILLLSDGRFGSIYTRAFQKKLDVSPLLISNPTWQLSLRGLDIPVAEANNENEFIQAIKSWKPETGPFFIECCFDPDKYQQMVNEIRQ